MGDRSTEPTRGPRLVPESVNTAKFSEQLRRWQLNAAMHARRGCLLLSVGDLSVDVGILQNVPMGGRTIPVMTVCARIDYWNFDIWPPSVTFLDPLTREPAQPAVRAIDRVSPSEARDALIDQHPQTLLPFLCLPGIREYHSHPQHSGDNWLLHRHRREGDLAVICERLWRRMARNVLGMSVAIHSVATGIPNNIANQLDINLLQGDPDSLQRHQPGLPQPSSTDQAESAEPVQPELSPQLDAAAAVRNGEAAVEQQLDAGDEPGIVAEPNETGRPVTSPASSVAGDRPE